jgi:hypothetical protein
MWGYSIKFFDEVVAVEVAVVVAIVEVVVEDVVEATMPERISALDTEAVFWSASTAFFIFEYPSANVSPASFTVSPKLNRSLSFKVSVTWALNDVTQTANMTSVMPKLVLKAMNCRVSFGFFLILSKRRKNIYMYA